MGRDFNLVELVRCKSKKEIGVESAISQCLNNFFKKTLEKSNCEIIICFGKKLQKLQLNLNYEGISKMKMILKKYI